MTDHELVSGNRVLIGGGDMRAELWVRGVSPEVEPDLAAVEHPQAMRDAFDIFRALGAEALLTQTRVLNSAYLAWAGQPIAAERLDQLNRNAAAMARAAAQESQGGACLMLGVIGPPGGLLALDEVSPNTLRDAYARQAVALQAGDAQTIALLGFTELEALLVAIEAVPASSEQPVIAGMTFGSGGEFDETPMGATLSAALAAVTSSAPAMFMIDAGEFPDAAPDLVKSAVGQSKIPIGVCLRAGTPVLTEGNLSYSDTPVDFSARLAPLVTAGARMILADLGAGPQHLAAMLAARERLKITGRR